MSLPKNSNAPPSVEGKLKSYIDRVLHSREREDAEKANTKEIYKELAGDGYDKTIVGKVVNHLRKDQDKAREQSEVFDLYLAAYLGPSHVHARVREDDSSTAARKDVPPTSPADAGADRSDFKVTEPEHAAPLREGGPSGAGTQAPPVETHPQHDAVEAGEDVVTAASSPDTHQVETPKADDGHRHGEMALGLAGPAFVEDAPQANIKPAPIPEPETGAPSSPSVSAAGAESAVSSPAALGVPSNVTPIRTHNPATHFLNSEGLQRLHGCLAPEACGSGQPRLKLCFGCSVQHDGPSPQNGVA